jgi:hypothetical protein
LAKWLFSARVDLREQNWITIAERRGAWCARSRLAGTRRALGRKYRQRGKNVANFFVEKFGNAMVAFWVWES